MYAAVQNLADAVERASSPNREPVGGAIAGMDMRTVARPTISRDDGTTVNTAPYLQCQGVRIELIWSEEFAMTALIYPAPPFDKRYDRRNLHCLKVRYCKRNACSRDAFELVVRKSC